MNNRPLINQSFPEVAEAFPSINPSTGEEIGRISECASLVGEAVEGALLAQRQWANVPLVGRSQLLMAIASELEKHVEELAHLDTLDSGNPIAVMRQDVRMAIALLRYYAGIAYEVKGEAQQQPWGKHLHWSLAEPFGVVARFTAFNHPAMFSIVRLAAPLLTGNSLILKPSEHTSLSTLKIGEILKDLVPRGLLQILTGGPKTGRAIVAHPQIKKITLTGGKKAALAFYETAAASGSIKDFTFELGGKNPMVIFPDADLEKAFAAAVDGMNFTQTQGQSCGSTSRVFLHRSIYQQGLESIKTLIEKIRVGLPEDPASQMGPLSTKDQYDKTLYYIELSRKEGLPLLSGGKALREPPFDRGYFVAPTAFYDVTPVHALFHQEVFGPVVAIIPWDDEKKLKEMVNQSEYGLTASIWTKDLDRAMVFPRFLEAGTIWINGVSSHFPGFGFGGFKNSGIGREECLAELYSFTQMKSIHYFMPA